MKKKTILTAELLSFAIAVFTVINIKNGIDSTDLMKENIEVLCFNEWGGGNDDGFGGIIQYEYSKITYESGGQIVSDPFNDQYIWPTMYEVKTCHGSGDLVCTVYRIILW